MVVHTCAVSHPVLGRSECLASGITGISQEACRTTCVAVAHTQHAGQRDADSCTVPPTYDLARRLLACCDSTHVHCLFVGLLVAAGWSWQWKLQSQTPLPHPSEPPLESPIVRLRLLPCALVASMCLIRIPVVLVLTATPGTAGSGKFNPRRLQWDNVRCVLHLELFDVLC